MREQMSWGLYTVDKGDVETGGCWLVKEWRALIGWGEQEKNKTKAIVYAINWP